MKIIVNADDFGMSRSRNKAIALCFKQGLINQTTIMVNMPNFEEAVNCAQEQSFFDKVGLHLNLMEGEPLTEEIKQFPFVCTDGLFNGCLQRYLRRNLFIPNKLKEAIRKESEAQIIKFIDSGFTLKHIDSHFHLHNDYYIYKIIKPLCIKYNIKSMRILRNLMYKGNLKSFMKFLYKRILNMDINNNFIHTDYFGAYDDYKQYYTMNNKSVEIMLHPDLIDGKLVDITNNDIVPLINYQF